MSNAKWLEMMTLMSMVASSIARREDRFRWLLEEVLCAVDPTLSHQTPYWQALVILPEVLLEEHSRWVSCYYCKAWVQSPSPTPNKRYLGWQKISWANGPPTRPHIQSCCLTLSTASLVKNFNSLHDDENYITGHCEHYWQWHHCPQ